MQNKLFLFIFLNCFVCLTQAEQSYLLEGFSVSEKLDIQSKHVQQELDREDGTAIKMTAEEAIGALDKIEPRVDTVLQLAIEFSKQSNSIATLLSRIHDVSSHEIITAEWHPTLAGDYRLLKAASINSDEYYKHTYLLILLESIYYQNFSKQRLHPVLSKIKARLEYDKVQMNRLKIVLQTEINSIREQLSEIHH